MDIVDKKYVFKVSIDEYNIKKLMPVFNVLRMSNDPDIIQSVCATATPGKVIIRICVYTYYLFFYGSLNHIK